MSQLFRSIRSFIPLTKPRLHVRPFPAAILSHPLSTTSRRSSTPANLPEHKGPVQDPRSSASEKQNLENKTGDEHPAKQPDAQPEPDRKTGFEGSEGVKGGKEGLGDRTDRKG